ncbi:MAG: DNA-processing protein DprA [Bacteroidetes bacterium]|nr:DNA-processing protein DprA [Bacteroidota bacterium]
MSDSLLHQIALCQVPQVGAVTAKTLVQHCGSARGVFEASRKQLLKIPGIGLAVVDQIQKPEPLFRAERELRFLEENQVQALFFTDPLYPFRLRQCYDCPAILYFKGDRLDWLNADRMVGIVGTRKPTEYGKQLCAEFVGDLAAFNVVIVSGLAYGIDITAHRSACEKEVPNIGVLGHGLASLYPAEHRGTASKMIRRGGLLTEYISDLAPDREHFPMRNRIIAGLCDALLVVETASTGGSMITADLARQYARDIFAIPGRVRDTRSAGCNQLIKQDVARLVESAEELALAMRWDDFHTHKKGIQTSLLLDLSETEFAVYEAIRQQPEIGIDALAYHLGTASATLAHILLHLEFRGIIRSLPGKRYSTS